MSHKNSDKTEIIDYLGDSALKNQAWVERYIENDKRDFSADFNRLKVTSPTHLIPEATALNQIQFQDLVKGLINNNPLVKENNIEVFVDDSKLSVHGKVNSAAAREFIDKIIKSFSHYFDVFNDIEVECN